MQWASSILRKIQNTCPTFLCAGVTLTPPMACTSDTGTPAVATSGFAMLGEACTLHAKVWPLGLREEPLLELAHPASPERLPAFPEALLGQMFHTLGQFAFSTATSEVNMRGKADAICLSWIVRPSSRG